jgi:serine/threonine protein kinase/tetratricopeptide (TPR) repeat protein
MTPERWHQVKEIFYSALEHEPAQRYSFLSSACGDDELLRREVESLISSHEKDGSFIDSPAYQVVAESLTGQPDEFKPGQSIAQYKIIRQLGVGGMGEVYLAADQKIGRKVALKLLPSHFTHDEQRVRRFQQEARAVVALNHPNIVTIHDIGEAEGISFIAVEFIEGETLRQHMMSGPMKLGQALELAIQVVSALAAAHQTGIIHRDIKPENIMLRADGYVKVLDFGLAKSFDTAPEKRISDQDAPTRALQERALVQTEAGVAIGTVSYMSPEQARGLDVDARTDIWSLAVVLYEMLTAQRPFNGKTNADVMVSILEKDPLPLAHFAPELRGEVQWIVNKALRKDRDERYQSAGDLFNDLRTLKQQIEFSAQFERSTSPESPAAQVATASEATATQTVSESAASTIADPAPGKLSSAEYIAKTVRHHKRSFGIAVAALLLVVTGVGYLFVTHRSAHTTGIESIAVLPFENMTRDHNTEYLSDGITESLINSLSQLPHVTVIARSSVFSYKNQTPNLQEVAQKLNVRAVLTGRVLAQGDMLNISVELMDTQNNTQLWGEHYQRKAADIFAMQDEIARQVTDTLRVRLTGGQQEQVTKRYTENAEAYRLYLQGRYYTNQVSEENLNRAVSFFDQAIALDPRYALAYAARGDSFFIMGDISLPMSEAKRKVEQNIAAALSIDDKLIEARMLRANIEFQYDWNFAKAEEDFKQVIVLNPNYAEAHQQYSYYLAMIGKPMEAVAEIKLAQQLDPVNPAISVDVGLPYYLARQYDQSIAQNRRALEMFPNFFLAHLALGEALFQKGDYATGIEEIEKGKAMEPTPPSIGQLGYVYAKSGRKDEARKLLAELKELSKRRYVASYWIAMIYVGLDEKDEAFAWLEKAYQERSWWLVWIKMDPILDSLRSDARFTDLMRRIGFPR